MEDKIQKKICSATKGCGLEKDITEFHDKKRRNGKHGLQHICKDCWSILMKRYREKNLEASSNRGKEHYKNNREAKLEYSRNYYKNNIEKYKKRNKNWGSKNPEKAMLHRSRKRAKNKNLEHNITLEDIVIPEVCPLLGIPLETNKTKGYADNSPSLDRIDSSKGYIKGNVMVVSFRANMLKSNGTIEELELLLHNLKKITNKLSEGD